uniref:Uncharacterized protein n=1 Tax=Ditylenchus dipsaci TaxID=166011 RepID=A0A915E391_9BILA
MSSTARSNRLSYILTGAPILAVLVFILFLVLLRRWIKKFQFKEKVNGYGKVAIVTGASAGIGKQIAKELNLRQIRVYMMCRNVKKGQQVAEELHKKYGCDLSRLMVRYGDLSNFSSVRNFAQEFQRGKKAGHFGEQCGMYNHTHFQKTVDGYEMTWQSNHLGHLLLTELLLPSLVRSESGGRIVVLSSDLHLYADTVDSDICNSEEHFKKLSQTYFRTKLANAMTTVALANKFASQSGYQRLTINSCHPGVVSTSLIKGDFFQKVVRPLFCKNLEGVSGKYFSEGKVSKTHPLVKDLDACNELYRVALKECGL